MSQSSQPIENNEFSEFLNDSEWSGSVVTPLSADMGLRRYFMLGQGSKTALLMDMSRAGILEIGLEAFVNVAEYFSKHNVRAPHIYKYDLNSGLAVIEHLGPDSFGDALRAGEPLENIYMKAVEVLMAIKAASAENALALGDYKDTLIYKRLGQFVDYYMPLAADNGAGRLTTQTDHDEFHSVLTDIEATLPPCPNAICHADYHLENLIWRPDTPEGYGLIDFQDAFRGFEGYDLLNLLEDARATVPQDIKKAMKDKFCGSMSNAEREAFEAWYVYLSMHFHCRVIGLFIKFARENGGVEFLAHIPRLQGYIKENLKNPLLSPLKEWLERNNVSFDLKI